MKAGVTVSEFWDMTLPETFLSIEAGQWRLDQYEDMLMSGSWHSAALARTKRIPPLKSFLVKPTKQLTSDELRKVGEEHRERVGKLDIEKLGSRLNG